jgi:hypothetical protein
MAIISKESINNFPIFRFYIRGSHKGNDDDVNQETVIFFVSNFTLYAVEEANTEDDEVKVTRVDSCFKLKQID